MPINNPPLAVPSLAVGASNTVSPLKLFTSADGSIPIAGLIGSTARELLSAVAASVAKFLVVASATASHRAQIVFVRARGTLLAPTQVLSDDMLAEIAAQAVDDLGGRQLTCHMRFTADGDMISTSLPSRIGLFTTPSGSITPLERLRLSSTGQVSIRNGGSFNKAAYEVAALPSTPVTGDEARVTDATAPVFGSTVVGGGAVNVPVFWDGANWIVG